MSCVVRGLCDELITRPEESYRLCCVVVCDLETSRMGAPYMYGISRLRVKQCLNVQASYGTKKLNTFQEGTVAALDLVTLLQSSVVPP